MPYTSVMIDDGRTGRISGPIAGNAAEALLVRYANGNRGIPVGTAVALLSPDGDTLAHAVCESENGLVHLNTATRECVEYLSPAAVGAGYPAVIAVGDTNSLLALVRCTVVRNWLAGIAPPAESAPIYPTSAELNEMLAAMRAAEKAVADTAAETERQQGVITQQIADAGKILTDIDSAKTKTLSAISDVAAAATQAITAAETETLAEITRARAETSEALVAVGNSAAAKVIAAADTALQSVTAAKTDAVTAVTAAKTDALKSVTDAGTDTAAAVRGMVAAAESDIADAGSLQKTEIANVARSAKTAVTDTGDEQVQRIKAETDTVLEDVRQAATAAEKAAEKTALDVADMQSLTDTVLESLNPLFYESDNARPRIAELMAVAGLPVPDGADVPVPAAADLKQADALATETDLKYMQMADAARTVAGTSMNMRVAQLKEV